MPLQTKTFSYAGADYLIAEAPMSFILPLVEAGEHDKILRMITESYTYRAENGETEIREGAEPLGGAVYDEFGMRGYQALVALVGSLNGLEAKNGADEEEDDEEAQEEGNLTT